MLTAFCNGGMDNIVTGVGDVFEQGGVSDFFNPGGCKNGMGAMALRRSVALVRLSGGGSGVRGAQLQDLRSEDARAGNRCSTSAAWSAPLGRRRADGPLAAGSTPGDEAPGRVRDSSREQRNYLRDLFVGRDLGDALSQMLALDGTPRARLEVTVTRLDDTLAAPPFASR